MRALPRWSVRSRAPWHAEPVASVEIEDEVVVVAARQVLAPALADSGRWAAWWPDLEVTVLVDRGLDGMAWAVSGPLVGVTEIRLAVSDAGVVVHFALIAEPTAPGSPRTPRALPQSPRARRELDSVRQRRMLAWKRMAFALQEEFGVRPSGAGR